MSKPAEKIIPLETHAEVELGITNILEKDKALRLLHDAHVEFDPDSPEAKRVLRKIDFIILPLLCLVYTMMLMDKSSLSFGAIMGIKTSCNLTASQYSWAGSIVYFGYLAGDIPAFFLLQRFPLARTFSVVVMLWGIVVALHAACSSFAGLATVRFLLGFGEVFTAPAILQILGAWYTKREQVTRLPIWYCCYGFGFIFGGFFAWTIYQADTFKWQAFFIFYGCLTFTIGIALYLFLPSSPTEAKWLTTEEKAIGLERVRGNKTGTEVWSYSWPQLKEALLDVRLYLLFVILIATGVPSGGVQVFGPTIIKGFGFTSEQSTLLSMGPGAAAVAGVLVSTLVAKYTNRTIAGMFIMTVSVIGCVMMLTIPSKHYSSLYGGYVLALQFPNCIPFVMAFMTSGVSGSTKKLAFSAVYQLGYAIGNIIGPQTYRPNAAPEYYPAKYTMLAFFVLTVFLIGAYGLIHMQWNNKRDKQAAIDADNGVVYEIVENEEFLDKTDFHIRSFRYPL